MLTPVQCGEPGLAGQYGEIDVGWNVDVSKGDTGRRPYPFKVDRLLVVADGTGRANAVTAALLDGRGVMAAADRRAYTFQSGRRLQNGTHVEALHEVSDVLQIATEFRFLIVIECAGEQELDEDEC